MDTTFTGDLLRNSALEDRGCARGGISSPAALATRSPAGQGYKFKFLGALEILSREAADLYFENAARCSSGEGGHSGGEDFYMKACLVGIGVDTQVDTTLLHDKYAAQNGCSDGWAAAFHFFKTVAEWNSCHSEALSAQKAHDAAWNAEH